MHLFSRTIHMAGPPAEVGPHAQALRDYASTKTGTEIGLWSVLFGAPVGTLVYTAAVDGLVGFSALGAALQGDAKYDALIAKGSDWVSGPPVDQLREALTDTTAAAPAPLGAVATVTTAVIANGKYAEAIGWGLEVAAHASNSTGMPVSMWMDMFGTFGQVTWIGVAPDAAAADDGNAKLNVDAAYVAKLSEAGDLFVPGSAQRQLAFRLG